VALGWLTAAVVPLMLLHGDAGPRDTLQSLGLASSLGMTVAAAGLFVAVRRVWGPQAFRGLGRTTAVALGSGALAAIAGRAIAWALDPHGLATGAAVAVLVAVAVLMLCAVSTWVGDNDSARLVMAKIRLRAGRDDQGEMTT